MTRGLRIVHRAAWCVLAPVVPALLALSVGVRPTLPDPARAHLAGGWTAALDLAGEPLHLRPILDGSGAPALVLGTARTPPLPDLLAYWTPRPAAGEGLPEGAVLLGAVPAPGTRRFALPAPGGTLVIYSLAHQRVVDALALGAGERAR